MPFRVLTILKIALLFSLTAFHAHGRIDPVTGQVIDENAVKKNYTLNFSSLLTTNLFEFQNRDDKAFANSSSASIIYDLQNGYRVTSALSFVKDFTGERELLMRDSSVNLIRSFGAITDRISMVGVGSVILPFSQASYKTAGLITGFRGGPTFIVKVSDFIPGMSVFYAPRATFNVHEFKVATDGLSNAQFVLSNALTIGYSFLHSFYVQFVNAYSRRWSYEGNTADAFSFDQSILWTLDHGFSLLGGHTIGGSALGVNGQDSNVQFFDSRESTFYGGLVYTY